MTEAELDEAEHYIDPGDDTEDHATIRRMLVALVAEVLRLRWQENHHAKCRDCGCDHVQREPGCTCHVEVGDSECVVHDAPDVGVVDAA